MSKGGGGVDDPKQGLAEIRQLPADGVLAIVTVEIVTTEEGKRRMVKTFDNGFNTRNGRHALGIVVSNVIQEIRGKSGEEESIVGFVVAKTP